MTRNSIPMEVKVEDEDDDDEDTDLRYDGALTGSG